MTIQQDILQAVALCVEADVPVLLWGNPGGGKSAATEQLATILGRHLEIVISSMREPTDFSGLPVPREDGVELFAPAWARRLAGCERGLLFLDEIDQASRRTQGALMRVVHNRECGELAMGHQVRVIAAANGSAGTATHDLGKALPNRFAHFFWTVNAKDWVEAKRAGFPAPELRLPVEGWESRVSFYDGLVGNYLRAHPAALDGTPADDSGDVTAYPTPRTWDFLTRVLSAARSAGFRFNSEVSYLITKGIIGETHGIGFLSYCKELDLPDIEESLAAPQKVQIPTRGDRLMVFLEGIVDASLDKHDNQKARYTAAWEIMARAGAEAPDTSLPAASRLARMRPQGCTPPTKEMRAFAPILAQIEAKS